MRFPGIVALAGICASRAAALAASRQSRIDRQALVTRHNIVIHAIDPNGAMAVGNGDFAFNFDVTGLQSFPEYYAKTMPIGILSDWGWHSFPNPDGYTLDKFKMETIPKYGRQFVFPSASTSHPPPDAAYLRENQHRIGLGRIGLEMTHADGSKVAHHRPARTSTSGSISGPASSPAPSRSMGARAGGDGRRRTARRSRRAGRVAADRSGAPQAAHRVPVRVALLRPGLSGLGSSRSAHHYTDPRAAPTARSSTARWMRRITASTRNGPRCVAGRDGAASISYSSSAGRAHRTDDMVLDPASAASPPVPDHFAAAEAPRARTGSSTGHAAARIDLSGNTDPRAAELERRIVLSQYVMAVHDAGSLPPQETGLGVNSWYGKFHMEMYWWHSAHWALWGHPELLEKIPRAT